MSKRIAVSVYFNLFYCILAAHIEAESNYLKPKLERNNIVNKGLWIRNKTERRSSGDFIFRTNSLDTDSLLQNNNDEFSENNMENSPFVSNFFERSKRSTNRKPKEPSTNRGSKKCKDKSKCPEDIENRPSIVKSKLISTLKPASVFNDYPYEVAVLLNNNKKITNVNTKTEKSNEIYDKYRGEYEFNSNETAQNSYFIKLNKNSNELKKITSLGNNTLSDDIQNNKSVIMPKRSSSPHRYETEVIKKLEFTEDFNATDNKQNKLDRNLYDEDNISWHNNAPIPNVNLYKILPKPEGNVKHKPMTERGLIKVLSILTKTFRKIMKQHKDIKRIHKKLYDLNGNFIKNTEDMAEKFEDFHSKYLHILKLNEDLKSMQGTLIEREKSFNIREKGLSNNLKDFERQQKKFLLQQQQFYGVQKLMLAQNEKINLKQNVIAKTQSEISHRQYNFARILKKAKQIYIDSKNLGPFKLNKGNSQIKQSKEKIKTMNLTPSETTATTTTTTTTTTVPPVTTEIVKINLFSIPTVTQIQNQDQMILDEKDYQQVDDLIYKYYFNNTFIDDVMKNKILASFTSTSETADNNITKNKRNESVKFKTTVLLPVNKTNGNINIKHRNRRWIKHAKKVTYKNNDKISITAGINKIDSTENIIGHNVKHDLTKLDNNNLKADPFTTMALSFCKEIGQTTNTKVLNWCVEKALRRLQIIDLKMPQLMNPPELQTTISTTNIHTRNDLNSIAVPDTTTPTKLLDTVTKRKTPEYITTSTTTSKIFFPDNDELEDKLKEYDIKPDTEGTVYYDGSLHSSDLGHIGDVDSEGFSDLMPGLDSNSRVQVDPLAFDLQAQRRADVRKINERIKKMKIV